MMSEILINIIDNELDSQIERRKTLLLCMDKISSTIDKLKDSTNINVLFTFLDNIKSTFEKVNNNIESLNKQKELLKNNIDDFWDYRNKCENTIKSNNLDIEAFIQKYLSYCLLDISNSIAQVNVQINEQVINNKPNMQVDEQVIDNKTNAQTDELADTRANSFPNNLDDNSKLSDNKTLLISEKQNKVFLPYTIYDLEVILDRHHNYSNLQDIIYDRYILPLSRFKYPIISRFKETFYLMRHKEKASIAESLDLALELSFNSLLNPAVIAACKNLDELDIYLDCLNNNDLDNFTIFNIQYDISPSVR